MRAFLFHTITTLSTNNQTIAMSESSVIQEEVKKALDFLNNKLKSVNDLVYPVGSIYMSVNSTSPATLFGGTWVALNEGRVLIGAGKAYPAGSTGGEASHTLTTAEMPSHNHSGSTASAGSHTHYFSYASGWGQGADGYIRMHEGTGKTKTTSSSGSHSHTVSIDSAGGGSAHNNMQPYLSVYMWKRTA